MSKPNTAIGIDFGGTSVKSAVVRDHVIVERGETIETCSNRDILLEEIFGVIAKLREAHPDVAGVSIGMPGFVNSVRGIVHHLANVEGWDEMPLAETIREQVNLPTIVENDVKAMTYAEWKLGAARGAQHAFCMTLGTGVGGGLILNGQLHRGAQMGSGEVGHASIDYRGRPSPYGAYGGLEEYVGNQQIAERAAALYRISRINRSLEDCAPKALATAALEGDPIAKGMWETIGDEIGAALANVVWIVNPEVIVIGGGVAKAGELLFDPIRRSISSRTVKLFHEHLRVVPAELGNDAGIIGNAALVLDSLCY